MSDKLIWPSLSKTYKTSWRSSERRLSTTVNGNNLNDDDSPNVSEQPHHQANISEHAEGATPLANNPFNALAYASDDEDDKDAFHRRRTTVRCMVDTFSLMHSFEFHTV